MFPFVKWVQFRAVIKFKYGNVIELGTVPGSPQVLSVAAVFDPEPAGVC